MDDDSEQMKAIDEAHRVLEPFFDSWVIVGRFSREDGSRVLDSVRHRRHGSFTDVRGLIEVFRDTLVSEHENVSDA